MPPNKKTVHNAKYPWQKWLKHDKATVLRVGKDFTCEPKSMKQQVRNAARAAGMLVSITRSNPGVLAFITRRRAK